MSLSVTASIGVMRLKLGLAVAFSSVASVLALVTPTQAQTTTVPDSATTTTTIPTRIPAVDGPVRIGNEPTVDGDTPDPSPPERGSQVQIFAPPPRPTTTTTTTIPAPDFSLPANSGTGRRIVYSKSLQKVWVTNSDGALIKEHRISGRLRWCDPLPGQYQVFSRSRYTFALANPSIIWGYMVRFTKGCQGGNIGFHEIPTNKNTGYKVQSVAQLGIPLSGGCVRQAESDAIWIWNWAYVGTKVVVLP
jgi:hypothetical protein